MTSPTPEPSQSTEAIAAHAAAIARGYWEGPDAEYRGFIAGYLAAARPEPPVEGALEEAREAFLGKLRYWLADPLNTNTIGMPAVERDLDTLLTLAAARSGHDGLDARS